jgi:signal peptidase
MLAVLLILENLQLFKIDIGYNLLYFTKILLWTALGIVVYKFPSPGYAGLIRLKDTVITLALIFSFLHLVCYLALGLFTSFGKNMYSLSPAGIASNLFAMAAVLFGGEMCRAFLIGGLSGKKPYLSVIGFGVIFALFNISFSKIGGIEENLDALDFVAETLLPQLALSIAASCLAYLSGPVPAIVYLGIIRTFGYLSPYIPNPETIPKMLFNVFVPLVSVFFIMKIYLKEASEYDRSHRNEDITPGWVATCALSVIIIWFTVGVFPIYPSVILTGSMEPGIMPGDIVLVEKAEIDEVDIGDVIMFNNGDGIYITHRIIEKSDETGETLLTTKGDNNPVADTGVVNSTQVKGKVIGVVPYIGKVTLYLRGMNA